MNSRVYIVLVNWNGWRDTIECLESVLRLDYPNYRVVVCDNASADDSMSYIRNWALGKVAAGCRNQQLKSFTFPPVAKPVAFSEFDCREGEIGEVSSRQKLTLIQSGGNLGFAGGCNLGARFALQDPECEYIWLLNNDTVAEPHSLSAMVSVVSRDRKIGMCGSLCLFYDEPEAVQAPGGMPINLWIGRARPPSGLRRDGVEEYLHRYNIDYINGASLIISRECLMDIGLLNQQYFLYFEEIDLALRAKGKYTISYSLDSVVYHKQGASTGIASSRRVRSMMAERFSVRSRILLSRRFYPIRLPIYVAAILGAALDRLVLGPRRNGVAMLKSLIDSLGTPLSPLPMCKRHEVLIAPKTNECCTHPAREGQRNT